MMTKIFGHRGSKGYYPENTLLSISEAIAAGVDGIEIDVHLTKDHQLAVIHDESVDRTTNGTGLIKDYTMDQLKSFKLSSNFQSFDYYQTSWEQERIPTLQEVLELLPEKKVVNIELKTILVTYHHIEEILLHTVKPYLDKLEFVYSCFHLPTLMRIKELDPHAQIAWLLHQSVPKLQDYISTFQLSKLHVEQSLLFAPALNSINPDQLRVWTVNIPEQIQQALLKGVEGIITDYPEQAIRLKRKISLANV